MYVKNLTSNMINLIPNSKNYVPITVKSLFNWENLSLSQMQNLRYPLYESAESSKIVGDEEIIESKIVEFGGKSFLEVVSRDDDFKKYRLFTTYSNSDEDYALVIEASENTPEPELYDHYVNLAKEVSATFEEL